MAFGTNGRTRHYRRHSPRCGGVFRQQDLKKEASRLKRRDPNERLFVYTCDGKNKKPTKSKEASDILMLPEDKFDVTKLAIDQAIADNDKASRIQTQQASSYGRREGNKNLDRLTFFHFFHQIEVIAGNGITECPSIVTAYA